MSTPQEIVARWIDLHAGEKITIRHTYLEWIGVGGLLEQLGVITTPISGNPYTVPHPVAEKIAWLRRERESMIETGGKLWGALHDCQASLSRLRGDSQPHASGDECVLCTRLATDEHWPFCEQCFLKTVSDYSADMITAWYEDKARKGTEDTDIAEMTAFLDELHAGPDRDMRQATTPLMHAFPSLSRREATVAVMRWMGERNGKREKAK